MNNGGDAAEIIVRLYLEGFEEVVKLDTQYIREWSPALDIKILLKTVKAVLRKEGSM